MMEEFLIELVEEHNMRSQWALASGTVQLTLIFKNIDIMLVGLDLQLLLLDTAVITTNFQYIPMDLINGIVLEIFPLIFSLLFSLYVEIVNVLGHYDTGLASAHQLFHDLGQTYMAFVGFGFYFYLVEITQPFPCDCWMAMEEFRC
jgi:hypothetical protein